MARITFLAMGVLFVAAGRPAPQAPTQEGGNTGQMVFHENCATCHGADAAADSRAPKIESLRLETADSVLDALTNGAMRAQAQRLNPAEMRAVAEYASGKRLS